MPSPPPGRVPPSQGPDQYEPTENLELHNEMEGLGQLANNTCCDMHWNAKLEVAAIEHYEDTDIVPIAILRTRKDIEKGTEILTRYWHKEKDARKNIFECQCCACTDHTETTITTTGETADMTTIKDPAPTADYTIGMIQDPEIAPILRNESRQERSARDIQDYPESEIDDWDWDDLEESPFMETTSTTTYLEKTPSPTENSHHEEGGNIEDDDFDHEVDNLDWDVLEHPPNRDTTTKYECTSPLPTSPTCEQRQTH